MSKSTISTFELFQMFPDQESARLPLCFLNLCSGRLAIDDKGLWFVCGTCGRVSHHMARGYEH